MDSETATRSLILCKLVVIWGATIFSFLIAAFGLVLLFREYRLVDSFKKMKEFIALTNDSKLEADGIKGTLSLGRMRPGLMLVVIASFLLVVCILHPISFEHDVTTSTPIVGRGAPADNGQDYPTSKSRLAVNTMTTGQPNSSTKAFAASGSHHLRERMIAATVFAPGRKLRAAPSVHHGTSSTAKGPNARDLTHTRATLPKTPLPTLESIKQLRFSILDQWLEVVPELTGKTIAEQSNLLSQRFGDQSVEVGRVISDEDETFGGLALRAYGSEKYAALIQTFNQNLAAENGKVSAFSDVLTLTPLALNRPSVVQVDRMVLHIAGASREQYYEALLERINPIVNSPQYRSDPNSFWKNLHKSPFEFADGYAKVTGRNAGLSAYETEPGDSAYLISRIAYGNAKFAPLVGFFNPQLTALSEDLSRALPGGTHLFLFKLTEY